MLTLFLNGDGMVNVHPNIACVQTAISYVCKMEIPEFDKYCKDKGVHVNDMGELVDNEDNHLYGTVMLIK